MIDDTSFLEVLPMEDLKGQQPDEGPRPVPPVALSPGECRPLVSAVIASYNMGQHLAQAVRSVLAQPDVDLEVIVVDDGSTDGTQEELRSFANDPRVKIITQENRGQPRAKNAGILASRGQFIAFCDADDYWLPNKLATQLPLFENNPRVGVVHGTGFVLMPDGSMVGGTAADPQLHRGSLLPELFIRNLVGFGTSIARRECFEQHGGFDEFVPMGIDWELWLRIAVHWEFDYTLEPTSVYRIWDGQMSKNWRGRYECALKIMARFLSRHPDLLPDRVVSIAYADTYTNYAAILLQREGIIPSLTCLVKALTHRFNHWPAWRLLLFLPYHWLRSRIRPAAD